MYFLIADRQKVLKHHPDKRRAAGEQINQDDDYFTCITKAWENLGTPLARRAFDSADPEFDDDIPSASSVSKGFYKVNNYLNKSKRCTTFLILQASINPCLQP